MEGFFFQSVGSTFFFQKFGSTRPSRFLVTVIIFGLLDTKSVNCHRDRGGQGRHPRNCGRFSTLGWCSKLKNVDSYRDRGKQARHARNCRRFRLSDKVPNSKMSTVTGIAESRLAILVTVDVFRLSDNVPNSRMSTVTGLAEGRVAILVTVHVFGLSHLLGNSKVSTPHLQNI